MNTPTHMLVAAALFSKPAARNRNIAVLSGAVLPDLSIFVLYAWGKFIDGQSSWQIWRETYWSEPWQTLGAISNSFPIWGLVLGGAIAFRVWWLALLAGAALMHLALDFPVHAGDAHRHFWPLTDWRFHSPFSYWDNRHYGDVVAILEVALGAALTLILWLRFSGLWVRAMLALSFTLYAAVPLYFWATLG